MTTLLYKYHLEEKCLPKGSKYTKTCPRGLWMSPDAKSDHGMVADVVDNNDILSDFNGQELKFFEHSWQILIVSYCLIRLCVQ